MCQRGWKWNEKSSLIPAVEIIAPGGSYNPDFFSHQVLVSFCLLLTPYGSGQPNDLSILPLVLGYRYAKNDYQFLKMHSVMWTSKMTQIYCEFIGLRYILAI